MSNISLRDCLKNFVQGTTEDEIVYCSTVCLKEFKEILIFSLVMFIFAYFALNDGEISWLAICFILVGSEIK